MLPSKCRRGLPPPFPCHGRKSQLPEHRSFRTCGCIVRKECNYHHPAWTWVHRYRTGPPDPWRSRCWGSEPRGAQRSSSCDGWPPRCRFRLPCPATPDSCRRWQISTIFLQKHAQCIYGTTRPVQGLYGYREWVCGCCFALQPEELLPLLQPGLLCRWVWRLSCVLP